LNRSLALVARSDGERIDRGAAKFAILNFRQRIRAGLKELQDPKPHDADFGVASDRAEIRGAKIHRCFRF
jgi:hypothetical protein